MTRSKKARSAALSARIHAAKMKKELNTIALEQGMEDWQRRTMRAFLIATRAFYIRKKLGHGGSCTVTVELGR